VRNQVGGNQSIRGVFAVAVFPAVMDGRKIHIAYPGGKALHFLRGDAGKPALLVQVHYLLPDKRNLPDGSPGLSAGFQAKVCQAGDGEPAGFMCLQMDAVEPPIRSDGFGQQNGSQWLNGFVFFD